MLTVREHGRGPEAARGRWLNLLLLSVSEEGIVARRWVWIIGRALWNCDVGRVVLEVVIVIARRTIQRQRQ